MNLDLKIEMEEAQGAVEESEGEAEAAVEGVPEAAEAAALEQKDAALIPEEVETEALVEVAPVGLDPSAAKEEVAGGPLLLMAYFAIWLVVFFFIFKVRRQTIGLAERIEGMERQLDQGLQEAQQGKEGPV